MANPDFTATQTAEREPPGGGLNGDRLQPLRGPKIEVEVEDRLFRQLKRRLFPTEIEGILFQAQTGDLYWQDQLFSVMVDSWPRLQTNLGKLKKSVSSMQFEVRAYADKGQDPAPSAVERANFVEQALFGMSSNSAWQYHDLLETVEDLVDSIVSGFTVLEVYWENREKLGIVPKWTRWIPARYYRYPYVMDAVDRLMLNPSGMLGSTALIDFPPYQFLVSIYQSHANFPVFTAPMRCLTAWWAASRFGLEWFMTYAQLFGMPQRIAYYDPGDDTVYAQLVQMMRASAAATWGVYPKGTEINLQSAGGAAGHMPQERLIEEADKACDILLLGQTLTTDVHDSGSRALGSVHKSVLEQMTEAAAGYVAKTITNQIIPGIVQINFGDCDELPVLEPVTNTPVDMLQMANAYNVLFGASGMRIPVTKQELYERIEFKIPEPDEELYEPGGSSSPSGGPPSSNLEQPFTQGGGGASLVSPEERGTPEETRGQEPALSLSASTVEAKREAKMPEAPKVDRGPEEDAQASATENWFKLHAEAIKAVRWRSVIDDRTTPECRELNRKRWSYPDMQPMGHGTEFPGFPPIRWNCRSQATPIYKSLGARIKASWVPALRAKIQALLKRKTPSET
jgi:phage gp29-like protein